MTRSGPVPPRLGASLITVFLGGVALVGIQVGAIGVSMRDGASGGAVQEPEAERRPQLGGSEAVTVRLSADTVVLGDVFELSVGVRVPPGRAVFFPDSIEPGNGLESFQPVRWEAQPVEGRGADLTLTYPVMAFSVGIVSIPAFEVFVGSAGTRAVGGAEADRRLPDGSVVGSWRDVYGAGGVDESLMRLLVADQRVWVTSVLLLDDIANGLEPRPAADVIGSSWNWSTLSALILRATLLAGVVTIAVRNSLVERTLALEAAAAGAAPPRRSRWREALDELDRLIGLGLHTEGRMEEFYTRSSGVLRVYVESLDRAWGPHLTSTELMAELERRGNGGGVPDLLSAMQTAEVVKFGRLRTDQGAAEKHWRALRKWVLDSGGDDS